MWWSTNNDINKNNNQWVGPLRRCFTFSSMIGDLLFPTLPQSGPSEVPRTPGGTGPGPVVHRPGPVTASTPCARATPTPAPPTSDHAGGAPVARVGPTPVDSSNGNPFTSLGGTIRDSWSQFRQRTKKGKISGQVIEREWLKRWDALTTLISEESNITITLSQSKKFPFLFYFYLFSSGDS